MKPKTIRKKVSKTIIQVKWAIVKVRVEDPTDAKAVDYALLAEFDRLDNRDEIMQEDEEGEYFIEPVPKGK